MQKSKLIANMMMMMILGQYPISLYSLDLLILTAVTISMLTAGTILWNNNKKQPARRSLPPSPRALPIVGHIHLMGPLIHQSFATLSSSYGPLLYLRFGSVPCIVASTPDLAKKFLKTNELKFCTRMHSAAITRLSYQHSSMAFSPYGSQWKMMRRMSHNELLGIRALDRFRPMRTKELHSLLHSIYTQSSSGKTTNVTEELYKLTNNIISQMMLRVSATGSVGDHTRKLARETAQILGEFNVSDFIGLCKSFDLQGFGRRIEDIYSRYDALLEGVIKHTEESRKNKKKKNISITENDDVKDFLSALLDIMELEEGSETQITRTNIKALVLDFLSGGTDTSSLAIEWCLAELINNPTILEKARQEIDSAVGISRIVEESDIKSLPYIQAIVKEVLRLHPPLPLIPRKSIEECEINGYRIPAEAMVFINIWAIGRDPNVWARPMDFDPERFLGPNGNTTIDVIGQHFELLPFGSGRRGCPGISLAMLQVQVTVAAMIQCLDWKECGLGSKIDMGEGPGLTAPRAHPLVCMPTVRFDFSPLLVTLASYQ